MIPASVTGTADSPKFFPSKQVWSIQNGTDWPDGIAVLMSFLAIIWTMSGYDAPFHLSEECSNANIAAPRAIVMTSGVGGLAGWALQLVVAYTVADISAVVESDLGQPWASYLVQVMPQNTALAILALTIVCGFSMGQGCMVVSFSRFSQTKVPNLTFPGCFKSDICIRKRRLFSSFKLDKENKQTHIYPSQCSMVQHYDWNPIASFDFWRPGCNWSHF